MSFDGALWSGVPAGDLANALDVIQRQETSFGLPLAGDANALHRNNFFLLTSPDKYDAVRQLISDREYWRKEEDHFREVINIVREYNDSSRGCPGPLCDAECPPIEVLKDLLRNRKVVYDVGSGSCG